MNIQPNDPKWTAYVLGELSEAEQAEVERELESSPEAREIVDDIRMMTTLLKDELATQPTARLSAAQRSAILPPVNTKVRFWRRPWVLGGFAVSAAAAAMLLAVVLPTMLRSREATSEMTRYHPTFSTGSPAPAASAPVAGLQGQQGQQAQQAGPMPHGVEQKDSLRSIYSPAVEADKAVSRDARLDDAVVADAVSVAPANSKRAEQEKNLKVQQGEAAQTTQGALDAFRSASADVQVHRFTAEARRAEAALPPPPAASPAPPFVGAGPGFGPGFPANRPPRPNFNTESYDRIEDNPFKSVADNPLATFSIDVDTAAYSNMRRYLDQNQLPPKEAVRIEELINYFNYDYAQPAGPHPIDVYAEAASAPWKPDHRLVRIAVKAKDVDISRRPPSNLVFLIDVSGSMEDQNKLPLLKSALKLLVDRLGENDRVAIVVYAGNSGMVLSPTRGDRKEIIIQALDRLQAGGSTNGASGIQLAYNVAAGNFIKGGINRVILCTDGDFNVGVTNQGDLTRLIEDRAKSGVFLSVLGFGMGNLKDSTMEKLADKGNGNYAYIDSLNEARKVLVQEMAGTLMTIAKDVKIQVDFNPAQVNAYRLIGYENRVLRDQDFNDDTKDAGDMGAGQTVTVLFEIVPRGVEINLPNVEPSKYRRAESPAAANALADRIGGNGELLTVRVRYKQPDAANSSRFDVPLVDRRSAFESASADYQFAAAVAEFGMILRESPYKGSATMEHAIATAERSRGSDRNGYREEFIRLARRARALRDLR